MHAETEKINKRDQLIKDIQVYIPHNNEDNNAQQFIDLLHHPRCFYRDHFEPGHITGSAIMINQQGNQILMNHHKSLNKWLNFGGHCDGEEDVFNVAIRETMEESGLTAFKPMTSQIIDLDIHTIPANSKKAEPEHLHFDIRYAMQMTGDQRPIISAESTELKWMTFDEAKSVADESLRRLIQKVTDAKF
jgi:8-oxo-dGTP pyrophosphatase MutT (NUDIX family)